MSQPGDRGADLPRLYLAAALIGGLVGLVGAAFRALLAQAERGRELAHAALVDAPAPGWLILMGLGALILIVGLWLVRRFAPETAGSGIPQVEACLAGEQTLRWQRVLPIKFVAGLLAVGSGLVLGREGPTVHMGAALGKLVTDWGRLDEHQGRTLLAAGAGAGLAAAFNAPLASIIFVTEELREHFAYGFASLQSVILACCLAVVVSSWLLGQGPLLPIDHLGQAPLTALPLFLVLGVLIGALGVVFNRLLLGSVQVFRALAIRYAFLIAGTLGLALGALAWFFPMAVGGGEGLVQSLLDRHPGTLFMVLLLAVRLLTTVGSYGLGLPGGIFAPLLALGTLGGAAFDGVVRELAPGLALAPGVFAVAAMGALFAATVRAPLTGIVLVIELTGAHDLGLPIILTCLSATFTAEGLGGRPIYSLLLAQGGQPVAPAGPAIRRLLIGAMILGVLLGVDANLNRSLPGHEIAPTRPSPLPMAAPESPVQAPAPPLPNRSGALLQDQPRYAIQLISFRNAASLAPFARRNGILDEARTLEVRDSAQGWYPLLLGDYGTRDEAKNALARLPEDLERLGPIIRAVPAGVQLVPVASRMGKGH